MYRNGKIEGVVEGNGINYIWSLTLVLSANYRHGSINPSARGSATPGNTSNPFNI